MIYFVLGINVTFKMIQQKYIKASLWNIALLVFFFPVSIFLVPSIVDKSWMR